MDFNFIFVHCSLSAELCIDLSKLTSHAMWWGVDCKEGWSSFRKFMGDIWVIDKNKIFQRKSKSYIY